MATTNSNILADIFRTSDHSIDIFDKNEIEALEFIEKNDKLYLRDFSGNKERLATPEEIVRQLFLYQLIHKYGYPPSRITLEKPVQFGSTIADKRADIWICEKDHPNTSYIIVEVKKPKRKDGEEQLKSYCNAQGAPIAVWTNGRQKEVWRRDEPNIYLSISDLPRIDQSLNDIINEKVTIDELAERNKLVTEKVSLRDVITTMENLVLANAGVDGFEEVFKLIYAKLYDESMAENNPNRHRVVTFRLGGTYQEVYTRINNLFILAQREWPGVFLPGEKIDLTPAHLASCVSFLQDLKLFNANLQIIDEAFEYLVTQVAKGAKGQYFTPRPVIDMAVKMLNPRFEEYVIDTASGSCGFTVHSIFHVWGGELTAQKPEEWQRKYASEKVYGLDFDARSVKIAKAINMIAGDGRTHVFRVNTLDPQSWSDEARVHMRERRRRFLENPQQDEDNYNFPRYFDFDVILTNPPFAGDIKDTRIIYQYDLARQGKGKWQNSVGRDILFIERNLEFLKPGGRMAIVLPQGRLNNIGDERIRRFISEHCRILAVVGLDVNTFKPHTGTKTSVLFLQKWNKDIEVGPLCLPLSDYPIFFAVSQHPGKDNSGEYIYLKDKTGQPLLDLYNHKIIDQDLFDIHYVLKQQLANLLKRDKTNPKRLEDHKKRCEELLNYIPIRPTIAEAFIEFAKANNFQFIYS
ncbi:MAG: N-6 DNA methylase [Chloroflexi bacterium]|uniref:N-6 DNA methylase n=1 Tax=Candidatus Chlorohelix allophototropha TaxID=3003348 RepID=A0A8T7LVK3_9CHLR|nr:N-6 DNA methylase [Chloroflexota bacterium]WJW67908.1 N-6 DNA methylase [Chloroflexota bacterium L227-S17]